MAQFEYETQAEKFEFISKQHGGYYRHDFVDHAYLYNLYFPPEAIFDSLKNQIHDLVLSYPVAQDALAALIGTLIVNIVGSFLMGLLVETMALVWSASQEARLFLAVGILGAFTTFSTFSLDVAVLYERGRPVLVATYIVVSVICSIGALFAGLHVMRRILAPVI